MVKIAGVHILLFRINELDVNLSLIYCKSKRSLRIDH